MSSRQCKSCRKGNEMPSPTYNVSHVTLAGVTHIMLPPVYQYDVGQVLAFDGDGVPDGTRIDFCSEGDEKTKSNVAADNEVSIPDEFLMTGKRVKVYIVLYGEDDDAQTRYEITIPVNKRPEPSGVAPTPSGQLVALLTFTDPNSDGNILVEEAD